MVISRIIIRFMKVNPLLADAVFFIIMASVVFFFWIDNILTGALLFVEFLAAMVFLYSNKERIFFVVTGAATGIWTYTSPDLATVPFWIFFCWGFTFALLHQIYLTYVKGTD